MKYLLDTNICIYLIKQQPPQVLQKFNLYPVGEIGISVITAAELWYGVKKSQSALQNERALQQFLIPLAVIDFDSRAAVSYGKIRAILEAQGRPIGSLDMLIAAHALSLDVTLVTNNTGEFSRVRELKLANWADNN
jgi:tRNA(fMet)-specific endonuclease VapC